MILIMATACGPAEPADTSADPLPSTPVDQDGDGILDVHEGDADPDGDYLAAFEDKDSDGDGLPDRLEAGDTDLSTMPFDSDFDRVLDIFDLDSDNNGILDEREGKNDVDGDGVHDAADPDDDGDGLPDVLEFTNGRAFDSDDDGVDDHRDVDSDNDGIPDALEASCPFVPDPCDTDGDGVPDVLDLDSDGDGLFDSVEAGEDGLNPRDTDGDSTPDWRDRDADGDGLDDQYEIERTKTDPLLRDTDGDGFSDAVEIEVGTNPLDPASVWQGLYVEVGERRELSRALQFQLGIERLDIVFLFNYGFSYYGRHAHWSEDMVRVISPLVSRWTLSVDDAAFAFVELGGYPETPWGLITNPPQGHWTGRDGCRPISVDVPFTKSSAEFDRELKAYAAARDPLSRYCLRRAPWEAFVQMVDGEGRDAWCDGAYDARFDVAPWASAPDDLFFGAAPGRARGEGRVGTRGGLGFRAFSKPVFIWYTLGQFVDPGIEHPDPAHASNRDPADGVYPARPEFATTPDMCPAGPDYRAAADAIDRVGGSLLVVRNSLLDDTHSDARWSIDRFLVEVGQTIDLDGDGSREPPVLVADYDKIFKFGEDPAITATVGALIETIENEIDFDRVYLQVDGDPHGMLAGIAPAAHTGLKKGDKISFQLTFRGTVPARDDDQVFRMGLNVLTDGEDLVDYRDILVLVPGRTR